MFCKRSFSSPLSAARLFLLLVCPLVSAISGPIALAQTSDDPVDDNWDGAPILSLHGRTIFPLYIGAGIQLHASPQLKLGLDFGTTPGFYSDTIASAASHIMNKDDYKSTIKAAFDDSSLYRVYLRYNFSEETNGFGIEMGLAQISAEGEQRVTDVAKASGLERDYRTVESLIVASGYRPFVNMKSDLLTLDILATYDLEVKQNLRVTFGGGIAKVLGAEVDLSTEVEQFDSSKLGIALLSLGETEVADGIEKYGITPLLSLELAYQF